MDVDHLCCAALKQTAQPARAVAPHIVNQHSKPGIANRLDVDQLLDMRQVGGARVPVLHAAVGQRLLERYALNSPIITRSRNQALDLGETVRCNRATVFIAHLEAAILGRVVAGREVDRGQCAPLHHGV